MKQLTRNMNISYSRGKEITDEDGRTTLKMDNAYTVLDDIKQTPRYWKKNKYKIYAKLDNFGPFQFFFTWKLFKTTVIGSFVKLPELTPACSSLEFV